MLLHARRHFMIAGLVSFVLTAGSGHAQGILYVDASATGPEHDGSSWCAAFIDLQDALDVATSGTTIRVADGTYTPDRGTGDRTGTFQLINGVTLEGGYAGCGEPDPDARDTELFETVLSGDIAGSNSFHVITAIAVDDSTVLDGFTVTGGTADGPDPDYKGGGLYAIASSAHIINTEFSMNTGTRGGGIFSEDGAMMVHNCRFLQNAAVLAFDTQPGGAGLLVLDGQIDISECLFEFNTTTGFGGALAAWSANLLVEQSVFDNNDGVFGGAVEIEFSPIAEFDSCTFSSNSALNGGGIRNFAGNLTVRECTFASNTVNGNGGAIHFTGSESSAMQLEDCRFSQNSAEKGGGVHISAPHTSSTTMLRCDFIENTATVVGGGVFHLGPSASLVANSRFLGNHAIDRAGGMWSSQGANPVVFNCSFSGNTANQNGGAMTNAGDANPLIINSTFSRNSAVLNAGGIYNVTRSEPILLNTILWANSDSGGTDQSAQVFMADSEPGIHHSIIQGWTGAFGGIGNIGDDPLFVDDDGADNIPGTEDDNLLLSPGSPALDAGTNIALPNDSLDLDGDADTSELLPVDLAGLPRLLDSLGVPGGEGDPIVDMGAFEGSDDCNGNGVADVTDIAEGTSLDCNTNAIPDECEVGIDCNNNGSCDAEDVALGESDDCNGNGVPDECERDCNGNGVADECDVAQGTSDDCNGDNVPDECLTPALDCNNNQLVDSCETADGISPDVNGNGRPDECEPPILFVQKGVTGLDNGLTWTDAFDDLQRAMTLAADSVGFVEEIWVASAVYTPDSGTGDRNGTFLLPDGVAVYGGFAGDETEREQRDPIVNETILTGDLAGNDEGEFTDFTRLDNAYHIVTSKGTGPGTTFDGFTITSGHATPLAPQNQDRGAGLWNDGEVTLVNLIVQFNWTVGSGAGMYNNGIANLTKCVFEDNWAAVYGGGMFNDGLWPETEVVSAVLDRCRFARNAANQGVALTTRYSALAGLINCEFSANTGGSGVLTIGAGETSLVNCVFNGNLDGAGFRNYYTPSTLINCTFVNNVSYWSGGGILAEGDSLHLTNCILWGNEDDSGSGETAQVYLMPPVSFGIDYCDIQGWTGNLGGVGNHGDDPMFVDADGADDIAGTEDDDLRLSFGSPCIDAADNTAVPGDEADLDDDGDTTERTPLDLDGSPRFVDDPDTDDIGVPDPPEYLEVVDMGAYEFPACSKAGECDDGVFCNGAETCVAGACQPGTAPDCDDGTGCTDDWCDEDNNECAHGLIASNCLIEGVCHLDGDENPAGDCEACDASANPTAWTSRPPGTSCGDPSDSDCDTPDSCDGMGGCRANNEPEGTPCTDDGDSCTDDVCSVDKACTHPRLPDDDPRACGACCYETAGQCYDDQLEEECRGDVWAVNDFCANRTITCEKVIIPTISEWGLLILTLLLATGIAGKFARLRVAGV